MLRSIGSSENYAALIKHGRPHNADHEELNVTESAGLQSGRHDLREEKALMADDTLDVKAVTDALNRILEVELAGVVRYTHYSLMVYGYNRIPIVSWLRSQASEALAHAQEAGEMITHFGGHPSLALGPLLETHQHDLQFAFEYTAPCLPHSAISRMLPQSNVKIYN